MTAIKKITDGGTQVYPQTHTKAVVDDNGYTAESRLQAMQDEINQTQMEIGAVPSDLTPTEGGSNWVTSGGIWNQLYVRTDETQILSATPTANVLFTYADTISIGNKYTITFSNVSENSTVTISVGDTSSTSENFVNGYNVTEGHTLNVTSTVNATHWRIWRPTGSSYKITIVRNDAVMVKDAIVDADTTPTKDNNKLITSGGVYSAIEGSSYIVTEHFNISDAVVSASNSSKQTIEKIETGFVISSLASGNNIYAYCTIPNLEIGKEYTVSFDYSLNQYSSAQYPYFLTIDTDKAATTRLGGIILQNFGLSGSLQVEIIPTTYTTTFRMANWDMGTGGIATISNISVFNKIPVNNAILERDEIIKTLQANSNKIEYLTGSTDATFDDITETGRTNASIIDISLDNDTKTIKYEAIGAKTQQRYAWFILPSTLINNQRYIVRFTYKSTAGSGDGYVGICSSPGTYDGGGINLRGGEGETSFIFTKAYNKNYVSLSSNSLNGAGSYIYLTNIRFIKYSGEDYTDVPTIESKIDDFINVLKDAYIKSVYSGEKIPKIGFTNNIGYKKLMNNAGCQAGAAYGGYYFQFTNQHASMNVYDLTTNTLHSTVSMTAVSADHCNTACFSNKFYDSNDTFPLIYTSGSQTGTYNHIQVWRIQFENDVFSITKVQEITLPTGNETEWMWGQAYLDNELGYMWYSTNGVHATYYKLNIPSIFDGNSQVISEVTITQSDVLDSFVTEKNIHQQGGVVKNGILYLFDGVPAWGDNTKLYVIDLWGKRLINMVNIQKLLGLTSEFEGCGIYNDTLIANTNGGGIYAIYF